MHPFLAATGMGLIADQPFMGKVLLEWTDDAREFVRLKLPHLIGVAVIAFILTRLLRIITNRMTMVAEQHAAGQGRVAQIKTLAGVLRATGLGIIGAIVGLQFLDAIGVDLAPLLASAGIAGVAIGLAAQNLVKDMLNGILILLEAQFSVGDVVTLAGLTGTVESMTLRRTTVRGFDGTLYVIPNSQITTVANQSVDFSVATVNVNVDFSANPDKVTALLRGIAMEVRNSPQYRDLFVADPQVLGMDALKGSQLVFPVEFRTRPRQQFAPIREFQRRVRMALEENKLLPGDPGRVFNSFGGKPGEVPAALRLAPEEQGPQPQDPTTIKPQESNPFSGD